MGIFQLSRLREACSRHHIIRIGSTYKRPQVQASFVHTTQVSINPLDRNEPKCTKTEGYKGNPICHSPEDQTKPARSVAILRLPIFWVQQRSPRASRHHHHVVAASELISVDQIQPHTDKTTMKIAVLASLIVSAAAFAPVSQVCVRDLALSERERNHSS